MPIDTPTTKGNVVAQFIETIHETGLELGAWRRFGEDVTVFLKERDLSDDFGVFQEQRQAGRAAGPKKASDAANAKRRARR